MTRPVRILVLEDNPNDAGLLARELFRAGFAAEWTQVDSEPEYVGHLDRQPDDIDIILADYALPGFDALRALRGLQERGLDIPFVVVTSPIDEETALACIKQGAADYVFKDRLGRLGPVVARELDRRRLRSEHDQAERTLRQIVETLEQRVAECTRELAEANERLQELDRLKSKFVSDVSHTLRQPVTNLRLYLGLLERGKPEKRAEYMAVLWEQADRLTHLVENILNLTP